MHKHEDKQLEGLSGGWHILVYRPNNVLHWFVALCVQLSLTATLASQNAVCYMVGRRSRVGSIISMA